ncbi:MAG: type I pantothenate kinase [Rhizobiaceae bacterium]
MQDKSQQSEPYLEFDVDEWATFRADTPLTLTEEEVTRLRALGDSIALDEVSRIYLSLSRLLASHVESTIGLFKQRAKFLDLHGQKTPFIIGIAGSVAVGKSTTARILRELLTRWPASPKVDLITTDGFLLPNKELRKQGLMDRKGFPESYERRGILDFLSRIKAGEHHVKAPVYSHMVYDVIPDEYTVIDQPDILIFEGINVLQVSELPRDGNSVPFVSDYFDFSIYIDADEDVIRNWYVTRFMNLRDTAFRDPNSFFHRYSTVSKDAAHAIAVELWENINLENLHQNILPTRKRADLILHKGAEHAVDRVSLRRL